ncbi:MAG: hypothetical protein M1814_004374 [Vezdaea aestivalis]|nr:MAG: hypothetical protein M1814_004374 [Vezdaea aestivalis]
MILLKASLPLFWTVAAAFKDSSPFFLYSTSKFSSSLDAKTQLVTARSLLPQLISQVSECKSDTYLVVSQEGAHADDYRAANSAPHLRSTIGKEDSAIKTSFSASDVIGNLDIETLADSIQSKCSARLLKIDASTGSFERIDDSKSRIIRVDFGLLPLQKNARRQKVHENDNFLSSIIDLLPTNKYTVLFANSPEPEMETGSEESYLDLKKRDSIIEDPDSPMNRSVPDDAPLFERYQYFTPGLFMGIIVALVMLALLSVGLSGLSGLQVTYAAFDKEMGPAAHKKQQ